MEYFVYVSLISSRVLNFWSYENRATFTIISQHTHTHNTWRRMTMLDLGVTI